MKWTFLISVAILLLIGGAYHSNDLIQKNSEFLFQTSSDAKEFLIFQKRFSSEQQIVVVLTTGTVDEKIYDDFKNKLHAMEGKWREHEIEFIDFFKIYQKVLRSNSYQDVTKFSNTHSHLLFDFIRKDHIAFLIILNKELSSQTLGELLRDLKQMDTSVAMAGLPITNHLLNTYSEDIKLKVFPVMLLLAFIILMVATRSFSSTLINLFPSVMGVLIALSTIKLFFVHMNMITVIAPLLVFSLALSISFHVFYSIGSYDNFRDLLAYKLRPISLMVITTVIGFGSLYISEIESIRQFALLCSFLIFFMAVFILGWYALTFDVIKKCAGRVVNIETLYYRFLATQSKQLVYISMVILILTGLAVSPGITILTEATKYLPSKSFEKKSIDYITKEVWGNPNYEVLIKKNNNEEFNYNDYKTISYIENEISKKFINTKLLSVNQFVAELNSIYSGDHKIPDVGVAFFTLLAQLPTEQLDKYIREGYYRFTIFGAHIGHKEFKRDIKYIQSIQNAYPNYEITLNGLQYSMLKSQEYLISTLVKSFISSFVIIVLLYALLFRELKTVVPFVVVNIVPILSSLIFIRLMNYSLNIATVMTFSISLGLIVDSTIHIIYDKVNHVDLKKHIQTTINPIIWGQVILILSFMVFAMNPFLPIRETGGILAFTLFVALIFDVYHLSVFVEEKKNF